MLKARCAPKGAHRGHNSSPYTSYESEELWKVTYTTVLNVMAARVAHSVMRGGRSEVETPVWRDFSHPTSIYLGPIQPPVKWVPGLSWAVKRPEHIDDQPTYSAEVVNKLHIADG